jgi:hypothetical protein
MDDPDGLLAPRVRAGDRAQHRQGAGVVASDRKWKRAGCVHLGIEPLDVQHGPVGERRRRDRHVAEVANPRKLEGIDAELAMTAVICLGPVTNCAGRQILRPLDGIDGQRQADEGDVGFAEVRLERTAEQLWNPVPVEIALEQIEGLVGIGIEAHGARVPVAAS